MNNRTLEVRIREVLTELNHAYGIGEIVLIDGENQIVTFKPWGCLERQKSFRTIVAKNMVTVFFCGHQKTVKL